MLKTETNNSEYNKLTECTAACPHRGHGPTCALPTTTAAPPTLLPPAHLSDFAAAPANSRPVATVDHWHCLVKPNTHKCK